MCGLSLVIFWQVKKLLDFPGLIELGVAIPSLSSEFEASRFNQKIF